MAYTQPIFPHPEVIGQFRTFGLFGPAYRILDTARQDDKGQWMLRVQVVDTDEEAEYPYDQAANDPEAD